MVVGMMKWLGLRGHLRDGGNTIDLHIKEHCPSDYISYKSQLRIRVYCGSPSLYRRYRRYRRYLQCLTLRSVIIMLYHGGSTLISMLTSFKIFSSEKVYENKHIKLAECSL